MAAYIFANVKVTDPRHYQEYAAQTPGLIEKYGGKFLVRAGKFEQMEGSLPLARVVLLEFADMAAARKFYHSPDYQEVLKIRQAAAESQVFFVEGV
jgi:uncharacterized protein (DUF1330 family)